MKRQGHLIEHIADMENLYVAFYNAQRGKSAKPNVVKFRKHLQNNLQHLQQQLLSGDVGTGQYTFFTIYDPKQRRICAAPFAQRVLHHALMNVCHPFFEKAQIYHSYACRKNKGTYAALDTAKIYSQNYEWYAKLDFRKYFDSINHTVLKQQMTRLFKDATLLSILDSIIDSYCVSANKGIPIGNLTSQYFANHFLAVLDHTIKESLQIKAYIRYMDDLVLWHADKDVLKSAVRNVESFAAGCLDLELKPICLNRCERGLPFLGYTVFPSTVRLSKNSKQRYKRKLDLYSHYLHLELWDQADFQTHVLPLIAFTEYADAVAFRKSVFEA